MMATETIPSWAIPKEDVPDWATPKDAQVVDSGDWSHGDKEEFVHKMIRAGVVDPAKYILGKINEFDEFTSKGAAHKAGRLIGNEAMEKSDYILQPQVERMKSKIDDDKSAPDWLKTGGKAVTEFAGRTASSPVQIVTAGFGKAAGLAGKVAEKVGGGLKTGGAKVLRIAVKPTIPSMQKWNPPNLEVPLREGLVPKFFNGGMEGVGQNVTEAVSKTAGVRDDILSQAKIRLAGSGAINEATKSVMSQVGKTGGLSATEAKAIPTYINEAFETAKNYPSFRGKSGSWSLDGSDAVEFRKWMDQQANFSKVKNETPREQFYLKLRNSFEEQLDSRMGQKNVTARIGATGKEEYDSAKKLLAELMPVKKAFVRRVIQEGNNQMIGLAEAGLVGSAIAGGNTAAVLKAGIAVGIKRLLARPGGAALLYQAGQKIESPALKKLFLTTAKVGAMSPIVARFAEAAEKMEGEKKSFFEKKLSEQLDKESKDFSATKQRGKAQ